MMSPSLVEFIDIFWPYLAAIGLFLICSFRLMRR